MDIILLQFIINYILINENNYKGHDIYFCHNSRPIPTNDKYVLDNVYTLAACILMCNDKVLLVHIIHVSA